MPAPITPTECLPIFRRGNRPKTGTEKALILKEMRAEKQAKAKELREKAIKDKAKAAKVPKVKKQPKITKPQGGEKTPELNKTLLDE